MSNYITQIHIHKLLHLENLDILVCEEKKKHLIITGRNGSGKTVLLNAIAKLWEDRNRSPERAYLEDLPIPFLRVDFNDLSSCIRSDDFIFAHYKARLYPQMEEPDSPSKPILKGRNSDESYSDQFIKFLADLKMQAALAFMNKETDRTNQIEQWFVHFEALLKEIFNDETLRLEFITSDYTFKIHTKGKEPFKFTQLADGFSAILEIVSDLILKMQNGNSLSFKYNAKGIVLIDEIETHLHLELQRLILPMLTRIFPNIQFIVTTQSPFVLNSLGDAVAFDLGF